MYIGISLSLVSAQLRRTVNIGIPVKPKMIPENSAVCTEKVNAEKPTAFCWPVCSESGLSLMWPPMWSGPRMVSCPVTRLGESCHKYTQPEIFMIV